MSRGFYVEGLIFGILRYVATDIKMPRSKFLAKMVSAKFAYQNTGPVCHILLLTAAFAASDKSYHHLNIPTTKNTVKHGGRT